MIVLREFREEAGLSQKELAERSSVTQQMISMIENNERKNPGADVLYKLACALGRTMDELYVPEGKKASIVMLDELEAWPKATVVEQGSITVPDRKEGEQRDAG